MATQLVIWEEVDGVQVASYTSCLRCGRALSNPKSRHVGYGPVCARKMAEVRTRLERAKDEYVTTNTTR